jgi:hypothetical protein
MKKIISLSLILFFGLMPLITKAEISGLSFFQIIDNMASLKDYKGIQSIYGDVLINDTDMKLKSEFKLSTQDIIKNTGKWQSDKDSKINAYLKLTWMGEKTDEKPFDTLAAEIRGEVITILNKTVYFKLDHINVDVTGIAEADLADIQSFLDGIKQMKGVWYKMDLESVQENTALQESYGDLADVDKITSDLESKGLEETIKGLADELLPQMLGESGMTQDEMAQVTTFIDRIFKTEFFSIKEITAGESKGFTSYRLNRGAITEMVVDLAKQFGESFGMDEIGELRSQLNKVGITGMYRMVPEYGIFNNLLFNLKLRNMDPIQNLNVGYRYKIMNINEGNEVIEPAEYVEFDTSGLIPQLEEPAIDETGLNESDAPQE